MRGQFVMSFKKLLLMAALIALCCILSSCGNSLPADSDSPVDAATDQTLPASSPDEPLSLSSLIPPDFLSITVNGNGVTSLLQGSEIHDFLDIAKNISFRAATDSVSISTPGAISCTISIAYGDGDMQEITLPYFLHNGTLYVADDTSLLLLSSFLDPDPT